MRITSGEANVLKELSENEGGLFGKGTATKHEFSRKPLDTTLYNLEEKGLVKVAHFHMDCQTVHVYCLPEVEIPSHFRNRKVYTNYREYLSKTFGIKY